MEEMEEKQFKSPSISSLDYKHLIDDAIYWQFLKYSALDKIIEKEYKDSNSDKINVYIDLYQMLASLCRFTQLRNIYSISAAIVNYCAHIRRYFRKINVYANIVLIYNDGSMSTITQFIPEYNSIYNARINHNKKVLSAFNKNIELLKILVPYLPNIYLRIGSTDSAIMIMDVVKRKLIGVAPTLVISNSQYMYQLPQLVKSVRVVKKMGTVQGKDNTHSYNNKNCMEAYMYGTRLRNVMSDFNQNTLSTLMTLNGIPKLGIKNMGYNYRNAIELCNDIPVGYEHDVDTVANTFLMYNEKHKKSKAIRPTVDVFINRFKGIDLLYQYSLYKLLPEYNELDFLKNLEDKESVHSINSTFYSNCQLDLDGL
ncbi:MAG: hypothetical protein IJ880_02540 [Bacilli bacterium]|nr:hypothetical protein [Bacilli bacterium]